MDETRLCTIILACFAQQGAHPSRDPKVKREYVEAKYVQEDWSFATSCAEPAKSCFRLQ